MLTQATYIQGMCLTTDFCLILYSHCGVKDSVLLVLSLIRFSIFLKKNGVTKEILMAPFGREDATIASMSTLIN